MSKHGHSTSQCKFPAERLELLEMERLDQWARTEADLSKPSGYQKTCKIDYENYRSLRRILHKIKYPSVSNIGADGASAAFLIAQHCGFDIKFMEKILKLMQACEREDRNSVDYQGIPYLIDRIKMFKGQPQVYGTQFVQLNNGDNVLYPIADERNVDKRRLEYDLGTLEECKNLFNSGRYTLTALACGMVKM